MIRRICDFDDLAWTTLLEDSASDQQTRTLSQHLEICDECRHRFEQLAAPDEWWRETASVLTREPTLLTLDEHAQAIDVDDGFRWLHYLQPDENGESLGSIDVYSVRRLLGAGGMGVVFEAFDPSLHRTVAIKVMHPHFAISGAARQRFAREAKAAAAVVHPNVVPIHAVVADATLPYLVMTYIPGESLQERLDREGSLAFDDCLSIAAQVADGLAAAHAQGLVHRDIKPANILLERGTARVWLTDFGLARTLDDATVTASGVIAGTPQYMSPEQASGEPVDSRSDLFSLGSVLYTMLAGRPPFRAESSLAVLRRISDQEPRELHEIRSEIPLWMEAIVGKLQSKSISDRFDDASTVRDLLRQCAVHLSNPQRVSLPETAIQLQKSLKHQRKQSLASRRSRLKHWTAESRKIAMVLGCLAMLGCVSVVVFSLSQRLRKPETRAHVLETKAGENVNTAQVGSVSEPALPELSKTLISPRVQPSARSRPTNAAPVDSGLDESFFRSIDMQIYEIRQRIEQLPYPIFDGVRVSHE